MVLDIPGGLFQDRAEGIPIESRASLTKDSGVLTIIGHAFDYTTYWSCPGTAFTPLNPDVDDVYMPGGAAIASENGIAWSAPVSLPHRAIVTGAIIYGNAGAQAETWSLLRRSLNGTTQVNMANANINTEDTSISNATIDNSAYRYYFYTSSVDDGDTIYGARITYTTGDITPNLLGQLTVSGKAQPIIDDKPQGYKTFFVLNNHSGSQQTIDFNIQNLTKGTTLYVKTGRVIANNTALTGTNIWSTDEISAGDEIQFEMTSGYIGTAGDSSVLGYIDWRVESVEETREAT